MLFKDIAIDWNAAPIKNCRYAKDKVDWWQHSITLGDSQYLLIGEDTDGDGIIDFIHADTTGSGYIDLSAFLEDDEWQITNLVEAWLEVNFSLPAARDSYVPHNVDIVLNGQTIASLKDMIPEGHFAFPIPPRVLRFPDGTEIQNQLEIKSEHLRGGHYAVTSDFQIVYRLATVDSFIIAESRDKAKDKVFSNPAFRFKNSDLLINCNDIFLSKTQNITPGENLELKANIYNLGMETASNVEVALIQSLSGGSNPLEIGRQVLNLVPLYGPSPVSFAWIAVPGVHALTVVIDPDGKLVENERKNNQALITVTVPGKDNLPQLTIISPASDQKYTDSQVSIEAKGNDESGIYMMEYRIDGGLWQKRANVDSINEVVAIQPGDHSIYFRVTDCSGQMVEDFRQINLNYQVPAFNIIQPADNADMSNKVVPFKVELSDLNKIRNIEVSINGGIWNNVGFNDNHLLTFELNLDVGKHYVDLRVIDLNGSQSTARRTLNISEQESAEQI